VSEGVVPTVGIGRSLLPIRLVLATTGEGPVTVGVGRRPGDVGQHVTVWSSSRQAVVVGLPMISSLPIPSGRLFTGDVWVRPPVDDRGLR
jgi:hypothetical protein